MVRKNITLYTVVSRNAKTLNEGRSFNTLKEAQQYRVAGEAIYKVNAKVDRVYLRS